MMPLPGNAPLMHTTPVEGYTVPSVPSTEQTQHSGEYDKKPPIWVRHYRNCLRKLSLVDDHFL